MIPEIDEALRKLLLREVNGKKNEVDVQFDAPKREWSSRLSKPTINLFLFDIRKNLLLRGSEQFTETRLDNGMTEIRVNPVRIDLRYLMSAWIKDPEDEHMLLSLALTGLLRNPFLPTDLYSDGLKGQPTPIPIEVGTFTPEQGPVDKFTELWGVLDNEIRPGILVTVTISLDPYKPILYGQVFSRELRFMQDTGFAAKNPQALPTDKAPEEKAMLPSRSLSHTYTIVTGKVQSQKYDLSTLELVLVEKGSKIPLDKHGGFVLKKLAEGEYHIDVLFNSKVLKRQKIQLPTGQCVIEV